MTELKQGSSVYTKRKEFEIEGITNMRFNQFKNKYFQYPKIVCADIFCGTGVNEVANEMVDGSPIRLLKGYLKTVKPSLFDDGRKPDFFFSDIRQVACTQLEKRIKSVFNMELKAHAMDAKSAVNILGEMLHKEPDCFLYLIVDPNGPKDFPRNEIVDVLKDYSKRVDVLPYISATTIKRCIGARDKGGIKFGDFLAGIENFDSAFVDSMSSNGRGGWIRKPIKGDRQGWTMIPTFGCLIPKNNWEKSGYVAVDSAEGLKARSYYSGGSSHE